LTAEYEMGDVLVFTMFTMHAASDNHTNRVRLSTDTRYQLASEPADERWIGEDPPKHGIHAKEGVIC
jgi:ectoine hydroxylase-related dioxygenase (phytanoyl-CoA dioxygenase family)